MKRVLLTTNNDKPYLEFYNYYFLSNPEKDLWITINSPNIYESYLGLNPIKEEIEI